MFEKIKTPTYVYDKLVPICRVARSALTEIGTAIKQ
jgi:hypothetical protein